MPNRAARETCCRILELRQYLLRPGQRDLLIELFDRHFVESQEELGIRVVGQFRVRDQPDCFLWIRGFPDMPSRARSLEAFYDKSPAWRQNKDAANATMIDFSNVLLLRPAGRSRGFVLNPLERPGPEGPDADGGVEGFSGRSPPPSPTPSGRRCGSPRRSLSFPRSARWPSSSLRPARAAMTEAAPTPAAL